MHVAAQSKFLAVTAAFLFACDMSSRRLNCGVVGQMAGRRIEIRRRGIFF